MKCRFCDADIEQDAQFCPNCGKDLSKFKKCVKCGELLDNDTVFCPHCGTEQPRKVVEEKTKSRKGVWIIASILLLCALAGGGYYFYDKNNGGVSLPVATDSTQAVVERVETDSTMAVEDDVAGSSSDIHSIEGVKSRLNEIFSKALKMQEDEAVKTFFSKDFRRLYNQVSEIENKIDFPGFWNGNIWDGSQESPNGYEIARVEYSSSDIASFEIIFKYVEGDYRSEGREYMTLVFEDGNWFIDDNLSDVKKRMKDFIEEMKEYNENAE